MHILNTFMYAIAAVVLLVTLMWGVSTMTAFLLMAYLGWKNRR